MQPTDVVPPVVVHGTAGSGKTGVTLAVLQLIKAPHVFVFCPAMFTTRALYDHVLTSVDGLTRAGGTTVGLGDDSDSDAETKSALQHDRFSEFVAKLKEVWKAKETLYLVRIAVFFLMSASCSTFQALSLCESSA